MALVSAPLRRSMGAQRLLCLLLACWNWKSAILSGVIRSATYFILVARQGHHAGLRSAAVEAVYVALTAGIYSGLQQRAMRLEPRRLANLTILAAVPLSAQLIDFLVQRAAHTPGLATATIGMVGWGLLSASFHLHLMRNGAMLVGAEGRSFGNDLKRIPRLVGTFVASPVLACREWLGPAGAEAEGELIA